METVVTHVINTQWELVSRRKLSIHTENKSRNYPRKRPRTVPRDLTARYKASPVLRLSLYSYVSHLPTLCDTELCFPTAALSSAESETGA